jgi:transcription antitermination factor NusG
LPLVRKTIRHARTFYSRATPLFPRYLFVELVIGRDRWTSIRGTVGVAHLMMDGDLPRAVPEGVVETFLKAVDPDGFITFEPTLQAGEQVRLVSGPFAGLVGKLVSLDPNGRVRVLLDVLGTQISVTSNRVGLVPAA